MIAKLPLSLLMTLVLSTEAFHVVQPGIASSSSSSSLSPFFVNPSSCRSTKLYAKKAKRGRSLGTLVQDGDVVSSAKTRKAQKQQKGNKKKKNKITKTTPVEGSQIAPGLSQWMSQQEDGDTTNNYSDSTQPTTTTTTSSRRAKQSIRKEQEEMRQYQIDQAIDTLTKALEENGNLDGILSAVRPLLSLESSNLKTLLSSKTRYDYRLAWVGSDDAICHVGTGLHKVPLARLQEVFLSCLGRNRLEVSEVIRILGPFPNVRNILQGSTKLGPTLANNNNNSNNDDDTDTDVETLKIVMDSMVDGTGKEILAGKEDNIRRVNLQIYFCDERAIVAVVPPESDDNGPLRNDPLEDNGSNILVFIREPELDDKLDQLRVS